MRSLPAFSVTSMRPPGRNASDQGCSRPFTTWTARNECSSDLYVWAKAGAPNRTANSSKVRMGRFYNRRMHRLHVLVMFWILASASISALAQVVQYDKPDREQFLLQGAKKEGEVMIYTSLVPEDLTALGAAFERKYGVKLKSWRANSEKVLQRAVTEARAGRHEADAVETNGPQLEALYREKALQPLRSPHLKDLMPQALRPHGYWVGSRINLFVQSYNTRLVKKEELPKSYADLAQPRWKGRLGIEAEDEDWFAMVITDLGEEKGLSVFREIVRTNGLSVRKGHTLLAGLVAS